MYRGTAQPVAATVRAAVLRGPEGAREDGGVGRARGSVCSVSWRANRDSRSDARTRGGGGGGGGWCAHHGTSSRSIRFVRFVSMRCAALRCDALRCAALRCAAIRSRSRFRFEQLFAYGTYAEYRAAAAGTYPAEPLKDEQLEKLRQLSIVSLARASSTVPYATLMTALDVAELRPLEDVVIEVNARYFLVVKTPDPYATRHD